jgi:peptide/nickel transport system permease protein
MAEPFQQRFARWRRSDFVQSFLASPSTIVALGVALVIMLAALFAGLVAPHDPFDPATIFLADSLEPPAWLSGGNPAFVLGTDILGRDMFSALLYGCRLSLIIGLASVALSMVIGVTLGLIAGYRGGWIDVMVMRVAEVQLSLPTILVALLINGLLRAVAPPATIDRLTVAVLILSIGLSHWVQFARAVRASTLVEKNQEYVLAARLIGLRTPAILFRHILPNVLSPVMVIATLNLAGAILTEASLSFLGVGVPATQPSLGTLINEGADFLFAGAWWTVLFPGLALALLSLSVNLVGDWLRDTLNPTLG